MKLSILPALLLATAMSSYAKEGYGQKILDKELSVQCSDQEIRQVLVTLEKAADIRFIYSPVLIQSSRRVSLHVKKEKLSAVLSGLFEPLSIGYEIINNYIVLKKKPEEPGASQGAGRLPDDENTFWQTVKGKVVSASGQPLEGVNIQIRNTEVGTYTDASGDFRINVANSQAILVISYVGFESQEIAVGDRTELNIKLTPVAGQLNDVVVVGYGTQKKINLTGAVASVGGVELNKRPVTNVANLLQGKVAGLQVVQSSGEPGNDNPNLQIRGLGTFSGAGSSPLVLVNGVQGSLAGLNPEDIESVSVLKDAASASIYGSRAANGVILVTTKQGKAGNLNINYSINYQVQRPTRMPKFVNNSVDFMQDWNAANARANDIPYFTQADIDSFKLSSNHIKYPNFDWLHFMIGNGNATNHHLSFSGGNGKTNYNMSFGYLGQDGINKGFDYKRYTTLFNINSKLNKVVTIGANINLNYQKRVEPVCGSTEFILLVYAAGPNYMPYLSDGSGRWTWRYNNAAWHNRNPLSMLSYGNISHDIVSAAPQAWMDLHLTRDLVFQVKGAINYDANFDKSNEHPVPSYFYSDNTLAAASTSYNLGITDNYSQNFLTTVYSTLQYTKKIADRHNISALAGYSQEANHFRYITGHKTTLPSPTLSELNAGSSNGQYVNGSSNDWAIQSAFGRINYDYEGKYLLEGNVRYDGSSRIYKDHRWGLFPSVSAGWRLSEESFMKDISGLTNLKLRASWGELGNQNIGLYPYQDILSTNSYAFNSTVSQGAVVTRLTDPSLKWETTNVKDIGVDASIRNGLFSITADWFDKVTSNILYSIETPASVGLSSPTVNYGKMKNTGFELQMGHANRIGDWSYNVSVNFTAFRNKVLKVVSPTYGQTTIQEGLPWASYYLTEWTGIFQSQDDIDKSPTQRYDPKPGDLKFKDQNGDKIIDDKDRVVVDGAFPKFYYGASFGVSWKQFDLSAFFQGVQGQKFLVSGWGIDPFTQGSAPTMDFAAHAWTPENKSNSTPAMYRSGYGPVTGTMSTYFLRDASYLRLKNLVIAYNVPAALCHRAGMKQLRVFFSGDNLLTKTKYPGADPERTGSGNYNTYPQLQIFAFGANVTF